MVTIQPPRTCIKTSLNQATPQGERVLQCCETPKERSETQEYLGLKDREHFRKRVLLPLLESGQLLQTIPDKLSSPKQRYVASSQESGGGHG